MNCLKYVSKDFHDWQRAYNFKQNANVLSFGIHMFLNFNDSIHPWVEIMNINLVENKFRFIIFHRQELTYRKKTRVKMTITFRKDTLPNRITNNGFHQIRPVFTNLTTWNVTYIFVLLRFVVYTSVNNIKPRYISTLFLLDIYVLITLK